MEKSLIKHVAEKHKEYILQPYGMLMESGDGFDIIYRLVQQFGGTNIYIPSVKTIFSRCLEREIKDQFDGRNIKELVKIFGYSETHVRSLTRKNNG